MYNNLEKRRKKAMNKNKIIITTILRSEKNMYKLVTIDLDGTMLNT